MGNALCIFVFHFCCVWPAFRPIRAHRHKCTAGDLAVIFFPFFYALERQRVIRISCCLAVHINDHQREDHFFRIDLVDCAQALHEMRGRINMRPPLADMREQLREKARYHRVWTLVVPVDRLSRFIGKTWPTRNSRRKRVCEIHVFFRSKQFLDTPKPRLILADGVTNNKRAAKRDQHRHQGTTHSEKHFCSVKQ